MTFGRDNRNELGLLRDSGVEQRHAEVVKEDGRHVIEDKDTRAGIFVKLSSISKCNT